MIGNWILFAGIVLICLILFLGINRYRRFAKQETLFHQMGERLGLQVAFLNSKAFTVFGTYRSYTVQLESKHLPTHPGKGVYGLKAHIPMINPNRKALRISNPTSSVEGLATIARIDRPIQLEQGMGDSIEMLTNDFLFSGIILSNDVKITLFQVFQEVGDGLLYLYDDELAFIWPKPLDQSSDVETWGKIVDLLCDMKDELNF
ncbi:MAG: hypothetical protein AAF587_11845 [Bacteroidota bacterium]